MNRYVSCACLSLVLCAGVGRAAAPPVAAVRSMSLAEAAKLGLEAKGFRVERGEGGSLRVSDTGTGPMESLRDANQALVQAQFEYYATRGPLESLRAANQALLNVEVAYWNLYQAQKKSSVRKQAGRDGRELLRVCEERHEAGTATREEVAQARRQCRTLRDQYREAVKEAAESERQLAELTGLGAGVRLNPGDRPSSRRHRPDWDAALAEAVAKRPELRMSRNDVVTSSPERQPRALEVLEDQEGKAQKFLELYFRRLSVRFEEIESTRVQLDDAGESLRAYKIMYSSGRCTITGLFEARRSYADAQARQYAAIGTYNNVRAGFDYGKGTTLDRHHMVFVADR